MQKHIKLGRVHGIEIGLHYSWFVIALLIVFSVGSEFSSDHPDWSRSVIYSMSVLTALLFFVALVLHELAHARIESISGSTRCADWSPWFRTM